VSIGKALQLLAPIKLVISELAGQRIKKVISIVEEQEQILKALGVQKMPKISTEIAILTGEIPLPLYYKFGYTFLMEER
jgi:hypothetical protein